VPGAEAAGGEPGRRAGAFGGPGAGGFGPAGGTTAASPALTRLLESGAGGYRWAAATVGSDSAASLELAAGGVPVMALGGFSGGDPVPTLTTFQQLVAAHAVHYFVASGATPRAAAAAVSNPEPVTGPAAGPQPVGGPAAPQADGGAGPDGDAGQAVAGRAATDAQQVTAWVETHFTAQAVGGETVYTLTAPPPG
jgi:hypothetical protein